MAFEYPILDWFQSLHTPLLSALAVFFDKAGAHGEIWIVFAVLLLIFPRTRKAGCAMAASLLLYLIVGDFCLKPFFSRPRPCDVNPDMLTLVSRPSGWSFPSGHSASAFAAAASLVFQKNRLGPYAVALAVFIGLSRLYLYVHYPTDVLAGALIGTALGYAASRLVDAAAKKLQ